ncbi:PKD domain-containing protein [Fibrisoma montanum]|uniref:PKD domain-containing protein n=1 Tax=Fibrisoma montanum TaxID=2305895 RepID=A0A418MEZ1_9BACT|nr:PKD domain-containing protein [Fibrisoma montanum]RIV25293.1 PKD domain-containing protein [Fibrisoma montanum]
MNKPGMPFLTVWLPVLSLLFVAGQCTKDPEPTPVPEAYFTFSPSVNLVAPVTVTFTNESENATEYVWTFGNNQTSTNKNLVLTFNSEGTYTITLKATGPGGADTYSQTVTINKPSTGTTPPPNPKPVADFSYSPSSNLIAPVNMNFTNLSTNASSYRWDFGDGTTSTVANPTKQFAKEGTYTVKLTATNANGSSEVSKNVVVEKAASTTGQFVFWTDKSSGWSSIDVAIDGSAAGKITSYFTLAPACGNSVTVTRPPGTYAYTAQSNTGVKWSGNITITASQCKSLRLDFPTTAPSTCDWNSATKCITVTKAVKGTRCGTSNSVEVEWKNTCTSNVKVVVCIQRSDGTWSCNPDGTFDTGMRPNQVLNNYVCAGTGKYKIYAMPIADFIKNKCAYPKE